MRRVDGRNILSVIIDPSAGKRLTPDQLIDVEGLIDSYYASKPDPDNSSQRISFGTSGHRGSAFNGSFNEAHILAVAQAICLHRGRRGIDGPLFLGRDTHALSDPAFRTAIEVFVANGVTTFIDCRDDFTPTPAISHAILKYNARRPRGSADGVILSPSHNPPEDGGIKYNPPHGGPAEPEVTGAIERLANTLLEADLRDVRRMPYERARATELVRGYDYRTAYVADLPRILDLQAIAGSGVRIGIDPLGGAAINYWPAIVEHHGLHATVVDQTVDPTFGFMPADWDGKIRMDCSSPYAMARLIELKDRFEIAFGNDPDVDRHGIVARAQGLMNPNHFLASAVSYLFGSRGEWPLQCAVGKTMVTSGLLDRLAESLQRPLVETPVGFRWFVEGLHDGRLAFAGEESAGASFLREDGSVWTTEKDGIVLGLLAAEMLAVTKRDPSQIYQEVNRALGPSFYERVDAPATAAQKSLLKLVQPEQLAVRTLAGDSIVAVETTAPGTSHALGGVRVRSANGWFAARPSGTEDLLKLYAESFVSAKHLEQIKSEARALVDSLVGELEDQDTGA